MLRFPLSAVYSVQADCYNCDRCENCMAWAGCPVRGSIHDLLVVPLLRETPMQTRLMSGCVAAVAAVAFLAGSPRAQADTVTLYLDHTTNQTTNATFNGNAISPTPGPYYWKNPPSALNANTTTFCVQLDQFVLVT